MYKLVIRNKSAEIIHEEEYDSPHYEYSVKSSLLFQFADETDTLLHVEIIDIESNEVLYSSVGCKLGCTSMITVDEDDNVVWV